MHAQKLRRVLGQEDAVLFVGAGVSVWSGLPTWWGLLSQLATFLDEEGLDSELVKRELSRQDLLQAASYGFDQLTKPQMGSFLRMACKYGQVGPHEIHKKIVTLGPRAFITTNYDTLLEDALRKFSPDRLSTPPVTNRDLTRLADITGARSANFLFKVHGDAADVDSIILTREQYRTFLPGGDRNSALDALKTLLLTRPVVYIGFGLRDPNFLLLKDIIANTYQGGARDHYAIMARTSQQETEFWRRNYGIHIIPYDVNGEGDHQDHTNLLSLLDEVSPTRVYPVVPKDQTPSTVTEATLSADDLLRLARYAAGLARYPKLEEEFPLRVRATGAERVRRKSGDGIFNYAELQTFLTSGPPRAILLGTPGAGKTYALRRAVAVLATTLLDACLNGTPQQRLVVPIYVDLKLYTGRIRDLIRDALPPGLTAEQIGASCDLKLFADSLNEMPRAFWDGAEYESDLISTFGDKIFSSVVVSSRTSDGLSKIDWKRYSIDNVDSDFVRKKLNDLGIAISGRYREELLSLLHRPFYFWLVASKKVQLPPNAHPRFLISAIFSNLARAFAARFNCSFDVLSCLGRVAYEAIEKGEEAQPLPDVLATIAASLRDVDAAPQPVEFINWLISQGTCVAVWGQRLAFFHQSATEYLASVELARRYRIDPDQLLRKCSMMRWDHSIFMTVAELSSEEAKRFVETIARYDFILALNSTLYMEYDQADVVRYLLEEMTAYEDLSFADDVAIAGALERVVPVSLAHEELLWSLADRGGIIGGAAVIRLAELRGNAVKQRLVEYLFRFKGDYNVARNGLGIALAPMFSVADLSEVAIRADSIPDDEDSEAFVAGVGAASSHLNIADAYRVLLSESKAATSGHMRVKIFEEMLQWRRGAEVLEHAASLLLSGHRRAATAIYFVSRSQERDDEPDESLPWSVFTTQHVDILVSALREETSKAQEHEESWVVLALRSICAVRADLRHYVAISTAAFVGARKVAALFAIGAEDAAILAELLGLAEYSLEELSKEPLRLLSGVEIKREMYSTLVDKLIERKCTLVLNEILETTPPDTSLELCKDVNVLVEWMVEVSRDARLLPDQRLWLFYRLSHVVCASLTGGQWREIVDLFNRAPDDTRVVVGKWLLPEAKEITTDELTGDAIEFLIAELKKPDEMWLSSALGSLATERFVSTHLQPLLKIADGDFRKNVVAAIKRAGRRHGHRYATDPTD